MPADDKARSDYNFYEKYKEDTHDWRKKRHKMEMFAAGAQWSKASANTLQDRDQVDIVVNKIRPLLRMRTSIMAANKPTGVIYGMHKEDANNAALLNEFMDWHWYNSDGQIRLIRTVKGQNTVGVHYLLVYSDNQADYGRGELKITDVSYRNVFVDKGAKEWDFSDAPRFIHTQLTRPEDFYLRHPNISKDESLLVPNDEINWDGVGQHKSGVSVGAPQTVGGSMNRGEWIREMDVYERVIKNVDIIVQKETGQVMRILDGKEPGPTPQEEMLMAKNISEETMKSLGFDPRQINPALLQLEIKSLPIARINYRKSASGVKDIGKQVTLPISDYPIVPIIDEDTGNAMPLGEVDHQHGIQELLNTSISLTLLNAALGSNIRMLYDPAHTGDISPEELKSMSSVPGAYIPMKVNPTTGKFPVQEIRPEPLNQAWFSLAQALSQEIEFQISTFSLRTGDPTNAPETLGATLQLGQWAQDILRIPLTYLESGLQKLFNVTLEWIPKYYDFEKMFFIVGDHGEPLTRFINPKSFDSVASAYGSMNSISNIKANYRVRAGSTMPSQSLAEMSVMQSMAQLDPSLITSVIDRLPGIKEKEKEEIKQRLDKVSQLTQQNQSLQEAVKAMQAELQHMDEKSKALERQAIMNDMKSEVKDTMNSIKKEAKNQ